MTRITIAKGDGIGPEIMDATLDILKAAGAQLEIDEIEVGEKVYLAGNPAGIAAASWDVIRKNKVFLKAPITTPQGKGYKSLNVTTRKFLGLYANVRPCIIHCHQASQHGSCYYTRKRRRPLCRHRTSTYERSGAVPETHQSARLRKDSALCL
jgi:isocitrate dehydrogenase